MRNPELTKQTILKISGELFNTRGYKSTSISHITDATGLTKGAIYKHFKNKDELEKQTFAYLSHQVVSVLGEMIHREKTARDKLDVIFSFFESYLSRPPIVGGCPLLNLAIESDDAHPDLRQEANTMMEMLRDSLQRILENGVKHGQINQKLNCRQYAAVILASLEGGIMMGKLSGSSEDMHLILRHLRNMVDEQML